MQAVILAAGEGLRLSPLSEAVPKCLLKIGKKTLLEYTFSQLPSEIREVILVVGHLKNQIKKHIGNQFQGRPVRYVEQTERLGTGHALFTAKDILNDKKFLVLMGDDLYVRRDMESCLKENLALLAQEMEAPERFGVLKIDGGFLDEITESQKITAGSLINCGLYVLDQKIFDYPLAAIGEKEFGLPQTIARMAKNHSIKIVKSSFWLPVNTLQDLKKADKYLKQIYL